MEIVDEITSFACTLLQWLPTTKLTSLLIISLSSEFALYIDIDIEGKEIGLYLYIISLYLSYNPFLYLT